MTKREEQYNIGLEFIKQFAELNHIDISKIKFIVKRTKQEVGRDRASGWCEYNYKTKKCKITINLPKCAPEAVKPTSFNTNNRYWFVNRTPIGVICHEFGHFVHYALTNGKCVLPKEKQITSYEPNIYERFAESIKLFILNPDLLKQYDPKRYEVLINKLNLKPLHNKTWQEVFKENNMHEKYYEYMKNRLNK